MIAEFLYRNPRILLLVIFVIVVAGFSSLLVMPRLEDPVLGKRVGVISTAFPGADARKVESLVTVPLENALAGIAEIKQVRSNSRTGISNIIVELRDQVVDVQPAWTLVRSRLDDADVDLPESALAPEFEVFPLKAYALIVAVKWKPDGQPNLIILRRLSRQLHDLLLAVPGTEDVDVFGDPGEEYVAEIEPVRLASLGLSTAAIAQQVAGSEVTQPAGRLRSDESQLLLDLAANPLPLKRIAETQIRYGPAGESVELSRVAAIEKRLADPATDIAIVDGQSAIVLGAFVDDSLRVDQWASQVDNALMSFADEFADEVSVDVLFSQRQHIEQRMGTLLWNLALGTAAVVLIVLVLMGWRSMVVVGTALPLSALMVITGMRVLSIPIHQMSVTGLIVALGLLIDNAIVIVENVRSRIVHGATPANAIVGGVRHLAVPLLGSTLTTALAFLPIATLPGPPGEFVGTIATSVILAICSSFILAMTVIPALLSLLRVDPGGRGLLTYGLTIGPLKRLYEASLRFVFRFPPVGLLLGAALPLLGFWAARELPEQFFPPSDRPQIQIELERPAHESLTGTRQAVESIQRVVDAQPGVIRQHWFVGRSAPTFFYNVVPRRRGTPFYAQAFVDLEPGVQGTQLVRELQRVVDRQMPDSRVVVRQLEQGPPFDAPVEIRLRGPELATLQRLGSELRLILSQTNHVIHTRSDLEETIPKLSLDINTQAAAHAGLAESDIAAQLYTTLEGAPAGVIYEAGEEVPVRVKMSAGPGSRMDHLAALHLQSRKRAPPAGPPSGGPPVAAPVPQPTLGSLSTFQLDSDVGAIVRINGTRVNEVMAYIEAGVLPSVVISEFKQRLAAADFALPGGYSLQFGGETEQRSQAINSLIANAFVVFALMLLTLVASFRSFRCAFIIATVGALSAGLGPLALAVFGYPFGFMAIVGTMGLIGVAINDSIVVLAAIRENAAARQGNVKQMTQVVSRATRHIVATTLTTIAGFTPLILGGGGFWPPLAITIAGGVSGATIMALYFTPSLHLMLFKRRQPTG